MDQEKNEQQLNKITLSQQQDNTVSAEPAEAEEKKTSVTDSRDMTRRNLLHVMCGGYLLYLAYKLITGFADEIGTTGWTGNTIIALIGAVVFVIVGIVLLVGVVRRSIRQMRQDAARAKEEKNNAERN